MIDPYFQYFSSSYIRGIQFAPVLNDSLLIIPSHDHSTNVLVINYDAVQLIESFSPRSSGNSNRFSPAGFSLLHDICRPRSGPEPTYINLHSDPQNMNGFVRPESTVLHLPTPLLVDSQDVYRLLLPSLYSQCVVGLSHNGIAEVLDLPKYVASTTSHDHKRPFNDRSLIDIDGTRTTRQPCQLNHQRHNPCLVRSPIKACSF
jgi:hypothetical protein